MNFQREMQERETAANPNAVYADAMREEKIRNVIAQLNPELLLNEIEHRIRGEKKDQFTEEWIKPDNKELTSEILVQNYISFLSVYLTQNNSLSNFSPNEINNIMNVVTDFVRDDLSDNAEAYGLTKKNYITRMVNVKWLVPYTNKEGINSMKEIIMQKEEVVPISEEITDYDTFNRIGHIICQSTFSVLKQAQNGMLASRIFKALRVTENINDGAKKSKMDFLKFW
jgi:predicted Zn-dependent peptidase